MKYCSQCGKQLPDEAKFCFSCGAAANTPVPPASAVPATPMPATPQDANPQPSTPPPPPVNAGTDAPQAAQVTGKKKKRMSYDNEELMKGVTLCDDGKYRWIYPLNMWKNPTILFLILKIFFWIFFGIWAMMVLFHGFDWGWKWDEIWGMTWPILILMGVFAVISLLAYAIVAGMYGGKYTILFTMDEHGINHEQIPEQAKKARKLGMLTAGAGAAGGSLSTMGLGISVASRTSMYSNFASVRSVTRGKWGNVIKIREILSNNQVYVRDEDYDFVYNYIREHCPRVK